MSLCYYRHNEQRIYFKKRTVKKKKKKRTVLEPIFTLNPGIPGAPEGPGGQIAGHCGEKALRAQHSLFAVVTLLTQVHDCKNLPEGHRSDREEYREDPDRRGNNKTAH